MPETFKRIPLQDVETINTASGRKSNSCFLCGKDIKNPVHYIHYTTDGDLVNTEEEIAISQGFFPVGYDCMKRVPKDFIFSDPQQNN